MQGITTPQIGLLKDLLNMRFDRLAWVTADATKDALNDFSRYMETNIAIDGLADLGLIEDVTTNEDTRSLMESLASSGRTFRVFKITDMGRQMFEASEVASNAVN